MTQKEKLNDYIQAYTLRLEASYRGGGIEIDLAEYIGITGAKMTAYQNYLGGGMLGAICNQYNFELDLLSKTQRAKIDKITDALNRYFHSLTNHEDDEWESASYEENQNRPVSAY